MMVFFQRAGTSTDKAGRCGYGAAIFLLMVSVTIMMTVVEAFVVPVPQLSTPPHHPSVALAMSTTTGTTRMSEEQRVATIAGGPVHVKKAGGGVPMVQAGDRSSFWDPEDYLPKCSPK